MRLIQKTAACLTLSCLLLPQPMAFAEEAPALPYRSQVVINTTPYSPQAQPLVIGGQIYLPLRWTFQTLGVDDVVWTPDETSSRQATISITLPSYFLLQQYHSLIKGLTVEGSDLQHTLPPQLYRISLPATPLQDNHALHRTPRSLRLQLQDGTLTHELAIYDYLFVEGQYYLSSYWFTQLFGAEVTEEASQDAVKLTAPSYDQWQTALNTLQQQLACGEPEEAAQLWIMAQEKHSGGLQYALLAANLRPVAYEQAATGSWMTATGSTTFGNASITAENRESSNKVIYDIQFSEMLSQNPNKTLHQQITVEKISGTWQITAVTGDRAYYTLLPPE